MVINSLDHGGAEHYIVRLTEMLPPAEVRFWVAYGEGRGSPLATALPGHVTQIRLPGLTVSDVGAWRHVATLTRLIRREGIQLVHTFLTSSAVLGWLAARACGVPVVFTPGGPLRTRHALERASARLGLSRLLLTRLVDVWVGLSGFIRDELVREAGIPPARTTVIPHGVDIDRFRPLAPSPALRAELGLGAGERVLCTIGSFRPVKGIPKALHLVAALAAWGAAPTLLVVGDGRLRAEYEALAADLGITRHVRFLGTRRDIPELLALSHVYLLTTDAPLLGSATLEALACGKPVVAFARDAEERAMAGEAVEEDRTGLIVSTDYPEAASRVGPLLHDRGRLAEMGRHARRMAEERFDFRQAVRLHGELYARLIHGTVAPGVAAGSRLRR
jgi:glycosyltransferase involved in cell wall biosynthesis